MAWGSVDLHDGEDEAELTARFVKLCARYPDREPMDIGEYVLVEYCKEHDLPNPGFRGQDMGIKLYGKISVKEAIAELIRTGGAQIGAEPPSRELLVAEVLALARDIKIDPKNRNTAYRNALEALGYITKQVEKKTTNLPPVPSQIIFQPADYSHAPEAAEE
jgi:hypothetical protein